MGIFPTRPRQDNCWQYASWCNVQGWLGSKDSVIHSGEGPIHIARWSGNLIAWANDLGVKVAISYRAHQPACKERGVRLQLHACMSSNHLDFCWQCSATCFCMNFSFCNTSCCQFKCRCGWYFQMQFHAALSPWRQHCGSSVTCSGKVMPPCSWAGLMSSRCVSLLVGVVACS